MFMKRLFNPQRLTIARQKRGMTKTMLADAAGVTPRSITSYEKGDNSPTGDRLIAIATALKFPLEFFFAADVERPETEAASFRAMSAMTAKQRDAALAAGGFAVDLAKWIDNRFLLPKCKLLDLRGFTPEAAAAHLRVEWGLGERPIKNTVHLLEAHGVRVFSLAENCLTVDAFSFWRDETPFVFLNTKKSSERSRFDAMHELGHLVLHRHGGPDHSGPAYHESDDGSPDPRKVEKEADEFASAMLMPRDDILAHAPRFATLPTLIKLKKRWSVALSALAYRLHALGVLSEWHYRTLCIQISEQGFRKNEPESCPRETSQLLQKVFAALKEEGISRSDLARELYLRSDDLDSLIFGLVLVSVSGGNSSPGGNQNPKRHLRIVTNQE